MILHHSTVEIKETSFTRSLSTLDVSVSDRLTHLNMNEDEEENQEGRSIEHVDITGCSWRHSAIRLYKASASLEDCSFATMNLNDGALLVEDESILTLRTVTFATNNPPT